MSGAVDVMVVSSFLKNTGIIGEFQLKMEENFQ